MQSVQIMSKTVVSIKMETNVSRLMFAFSEGTDGREIDEEEEEEEERRMK